MGEGGGGVFETWKRGLQECGDLEEGFVRVGLWEYARR